MSCILGRRGEAERHESSPPRAPPGLRPRPGWQGGGDDALLTQAFINMGEYYFDRQARPAPARRGAVLL